MLPSRRAVVHCALHLSDLSSARSSLDSSSKCDCTTLKSKEEAFVDNILKHSSEGIEDFKQSRLATNYRKWLISVIQ